MFEEGIQLKQLPIDKLEKGMHKNEVIRLLGSPQSNPFTPNTWNRAQQVQQICLRQV